MADPIPATCVHEGGFEHPSDGTLPCPLAEAVRPLRKYLESLKDQLADLKKCDPR